jgi:pimeloyl-ACP methyl ester carboxylesterase
VDVTSAGSSRGDLERRWSPQVALTSVAVTRRTNHRNFGTVTRYAVTTDDGVELEVIHGQSSVRRDLPVHLTIGTAPPLSLGPEGLIMHFLLKSMETGLDGIAFGPERAERTRDVDAIRACAGQMSFPRTAHVSHLVCDRLAAMTSTDLGHMLWTGVSLGAMKGMAFAAFAPERDRRMVYSQFVVPVCPFPEPLPSAEELRRFSRGELGAMVRLSSGLVAHDMRRRMFSVNPNVLRAVRPGLMARYARSMPRDSVSSIFTEAWRTAVVSGDGGVAATRLPADRLATFELFDHDEGGRADAWRLRLEGKLGGSIRVIVKRGRHTDAMRLSNQTSRARHIGRVLRQLRDGVPVEELSHPYG